MSKFSSVIQGHQIRTRKIRGRHSGAAQRSPESRGSEFARYAPNPNFEAKHGLSISGFRAPLRGPGMTINFVVPFQQPSNMTKH